MKKTRKSVLHAMIAMILLLAGCGGGGGSGSSGSVEDRGEVVQSAEAQEINRQIVEQGADWNADDNEISNLSEADRATLQSALEPEAPILNRVSPRVALQSLPDNIDWRDKSGSSWVTPIKNQGQCGSCVAFASLGVVESLAKIFNGNPGMDIDLSEADLYFCNGRQCSPGGWQLGSSATSIRDNGVTIESCFPYSAQQLSCNSKCGNYSANLTSIESWSWIQSDEASIKAALLNGPVMAAIDVYNDFYYYNSGVYQHVSGAYKGGHAVAIVGYDDIGGYWIVRNSWGTYWGNNGYVNIKFGEVGIEDWVLAMDMGTSEVSVTANAPSVPVALPDGGGNAQASVSCATTGSVSTVEIRCNSTRSWIAVPGGIATCEYAGTGEFTPACRINGSIIDEVDSPLTIAASPSTTVTASISPESGIVNTRMILTCDYGDGAPNSLHARCNTNHPWQKLRDRNWKLCKYRVAGSYTPECRLRSGSQVVTDTVDTSVTITNPTKVYTNRNPTTGTINETYTVTCTYTGTEPDAIQYRCASGLAFHTIQAGENSGTCTYDKAGVYYVTCRVSGVSNMHRKVTVTN